MRGTVLAGRYRLGPLLGAGGMGRVHAAYDELLDREVAVKLLRDGDARDPELVERFRREARSAGSLSHPNSVRVFDAGYAEGPHGPLPYIAMELVRGGTLKERLREVGGPLPPREAAAVALQVAGALGEAHGLGIVHRDVKPENVLLGQRGQAKVADFGIARAAQACTMTRTGMVLGTAAYVSPEQAAGEPSGPSADLYSLGVVLYEMLVGRPPFGPAGTDTTPLAVAMRHLRTIPLPPRRLDPTLPPDLERVTLTLLQKRPGDRYGSALALASDLERFLDGRQPMVVRASAAPIPAGAAAPAPAPGRTGRRRRRGRALRLVAAVAFVLSASASGAAATGLLPTGGAAWLPPVPGPVRRLVGVVLPQQPVPRVIEPYPISQLDGRPAVDLTGSGGRPGTLGAADPTTDPATDRPQTVSEAGRGGEAPRTYREIPRERTVVEDRALEQTFAEDPPAEPGPTGSPHRVQDPAPEP